MKSSGRRRISIDRRFQRRRGATFATYIWLGSCGSAARAANKRSRRKMMEAAKMRCHHAENNIKYNIHLLVKRARS